MTIKEQVGYVKLAAPKMAGCSNEIRNAALKAAAEALLAHQSEIFEANRQDLVKAESDHVAAPVMKRLKFDEKKLQDVVAGMYDLIAMPDPLFQIQLARELDEGLRLYRETCPMRSNKILFDIIYEAVQKAGLPENCMMQLEARSEITELLECHESVDLLIPRGSNAFVQYIMNNTKIPVMGHADGICHIYVDKDADISKAVPVIIDAKTQYVSACNTVETLLVHKDIVKALMVELAKALNAKNVELRGDERIQSLTACVPVTDADDHTEYLDYILSARVVENIDQAIDHINTNGSHHTDAIITENDEAALYFMRMVDSAGVYQNCSTRFADGYRYGFGAEVGISTSKIHARGPVGLEGLLSYKYKLFGNGHIVEDYASGKKQFHFKDIK